ncbi:hypothetical protein Patl1_02912 [Pistacia atlantica]|uniref:Uncharacterized protein n=1 Tax=Pistacia atlantica TaxID=434234 RepID=A0ACC1C719_9ROSI|nr:hypothetical protein Patl1_02912 [Pistacia atlantica]
MAGQDKGRPLPKFGEWDVNNPASAEGFTVIFTKARDEKKSSGTAASATRPPSQRNIPKPEEYQHPPSVCITFLSVTIKPACISKNGSAVSEIGKMAMALELQIHPSGMKIFMCACGTAIGEIYDG